MGIPKSNVQVSNETYQSLASHLSYLVSPNISHIISMEIYNFANAS